VLTYKRDESLAGPTPGYVPGKERTRRQWILITLVGVGVTLALIIPLALVPVAQTSNFSLPACPNGGHNVDLELGTSVSGGWKEPDASRVAFGVSQEGTDFYSATSTNGSFQFTVSSAGPVSFYDAGVSTGNGCTSADVQVSLHWTSPILWELSGPD